MALPDSFIQDLKIKTDINDVISTYVTLKKRGSTYIGLCPFHNEKTPSFTVYPDTQSFYCFGCGAGGDAIGFIKKIENLDYIDSVKLLAQRAGLAMPEDKTYDNSLAKKRKRILEINRETAKFYHSYMMSENGKVGLEYFLNRGLSIKTINHFGLGYAPNSWDSLLKHLKSLGYYLPEMAEAGVIKKGNKGYYDIFRNRVMTPIIDVRGNVIAFGGRVLDDTKPKYINTSDTLVYKKTNELFALNFAKDSGSDAIILCEGYMDVIAMHQAGFTSAVAGCGTALTNEQVKLISRYTDEVILAYDADEAGQKALNKAMSMFGNTSVKVRIPSLTGGKDPDEIIKTHGREKFKAMLEGASNEIEFSLLNVRKKYNLAFTQGKIDFINDAIKILADSTPVECDLYLSRLSEELGIEKNNIKIQLDNYRNRRKSSENRRKYAKIVDENLKSSKKSSIDSGTNIKTVKAQERLIGLLLLYPDCIKCISDFDSSRISNGFYKNIFEIVKKRIDNNDDIDLMDFSSILSDNEISKLSGIIARTGKSAQPKKEVTDCISLLNKEFENQQNINTSDMSDDDFRSLFTNNT